MSKAQSKGQNMKGRNPSDSSSALDHTDDNLDSNQSAQSMSAGDDASIAGEETTAADSSSGSMNEESSTGSFGEPKDLEGSSSRQTSSSSSDQGDDKSLLSKAASVLDAQAVKKNLNIVKDKASEYISSGREQISSKYADLSDDVKLRGMMVNDNVKANPYAYAVGAFGVGFLVGRALSGKGKSDLDFLVSAVNKINISSLAGALGLHIGEDEPKASSQGTGSYNKRQARKIG
jgi:ElaB/YqjD/DUF883 family membrane-anchored ribosome-binding protein